jgi:hypothetical protein
MSFDNILNEENNKLFIQKVKMDNDSKLDRFININIPKETKEQAKNYHNNIFYDFSEFKKFGYKITNI